MKAMRVVGMLVLGCALLMAVGGCATGGTDKLGLTGNPIEDLKSAAARLTNDFSLGTFNLDEACARAQEIKDRTDGLLALASQVMDFNPDPQSKAYYEAVKLGKATVDGMLANVCNWNTETNAVPDGSIPVVPPAAPAWEPYYTRVYHLYFQAPGADRVAVPLEAQVFWLPEYVSKPPPAPPRAEPIYVDPAKVMETISPTNPPSAGPSTNEPTGPDAVNDHDTDV